MRSPPLLVTPRRTLLLLFSALCIVCVLVLAVLRRGTSTWDGRGRLTLIFQISGKSQQDLPSSLALLTLEPQTKRALLLSIPASTLLSVPYGFGLYPASSVYSLGELDSNRRGGELLSGSFERTLGVAVDSHILISDGVLKALPTSHEELLELKKQFFTYRGLLRMMPFIAGKTSQVVTPLSFVDRWRLFWAVKRLRADQITYLDAAKLELLDLKIRPDGSMVHVFHTDRFDLLLSDSFTDHTIRSDSQTVTIVNASGQALLAATVERVLTHLGVNVIGKSTAKDILSAACVVTYTQRNQKESNLVVKLTRRWRCSLAEVKEVLQSDIVITLGEAFIR